MQAYPSILLTGVPGWLGNALLPKLGRLRQSGATKPLRFLIDTALPQRLVEWVEDATPRVDGDLDIVRGDLAEAETARIATAELRGGVVIHAAGVIHPRRTSDWYRINRDGTVQLATAAKAAGVRRFVFVSSNAAQGAASSREQLLSEDMPCNPLSHYGKSKFEAEQALMLLHEPGVFDVVIARPCMFYGPPVPDRHLDIFRRIRRGRLPQVGDGLYARSISYIDDLVEGLILCAAHDNAPGEIFNLCDERVSTTLEICEAMAKALDVPAKFIRIPVFSASLAYGVDRALASVGLYSMPFHLLGEANWNVGCSSRKAVERLGYKTTVDVFEGYRRAVEWVKRSGMEL